MRISASVAALVAAAALAGAGLAAAQDTPESILPPGFGDTPTPTPVPRATPSPGATQALPGDGLTDNLSAIAPLPDETPSATPTPDAKEMARLLAEYELPTFARRPLSSVGPVTTADGGLAPDAFGGADGRMLEALMRRLNTPIASRWLSIALRRALVSQLDTPSHTNGADFAAERAWLLLRMGESVSARDVVQGVDNANFTPKLYQVAMQVALATSDPAALCSLAGPAQAATGEAGWTLARAMCAALSGQPRVATAAIKDARRRHVAGGIDLQLAQKVVGAGPQGGQAITIEWDPVSQLTAWRYGLATATGVTIPDTLYATVGPQVTSWRALSPVIPLGDRTAPAEAAASRGVLSSAALVDLFGAVAEADEMPATASGVAADLRSAYADPSMDQRRAALRRLWGAQAGAVPYARLVMTAGAASRVRPADKDADADHLVAAMLTAGLDRTAMRWQQHVAEGGDAWAMLLLADPDAMAEVTYRNVSGYSGTGDVAAKRRLLFAGLAGLGRMSTDEAERAAESLGVRVGAENGWTRALSRAAEARQPATVLLLAAIGMQTPEWRGVSPEALYRIVLALRTVGLEGEARMIAAEAIARA